jgi:hypothetical protein
MALTLKNLAKLGLFNGKANKKARETAGLYLISQVDGGLKNLAQVARIWIFYQVSFKHLGSNGF